MAKIFFRRFGVLVICGVIENELLSLYGQRLLRYRYVVKFAAKVAAESRAGTAWQCTGPQNNRLLAINSDIP